MSIIYLTKLVLKSRSIYLFILYWLTSYFPRVTDRKRPSWRIWKYFQILIHEFFLLKTDLQLNPAKVLYFRFLELKMNILSISSMFACLVLPGIFLVFHKNTNVRHLSRMNDLIEAICSTCFGLRVILALLSYLRSLISLLGHILWETTF